MTWSRNTPPRPWTSRADRLPVNDLRIDQAADVLDHETIDDLHVASSRIDGDMRGLRAVRPGVLALGERAFDGERTAVRDRACAELRERNGAIAGSDDAAVSELDVLRRAAEPSRSGLADQRPQLVGGVEYGGAAHDRGARMVAAGAVADQAGRSVQDADAFERQPERVGGHLRKGRFDALPERRRPDPEQYLPSASTVRRAFSAGPPPPLCTKQVTATP